MTGRSAFPDCPREADVLEAVAYDRIERVRDHLAQCATCAEIADIAGLLRSDYSDTQREARVPSAGGVWWRATIRARAEAARTVSKPITVAQSVAGACAVGIGAGLVSIVRRGLPALGTFGDMAARFDVWRDDLTPGLAAILQHALPLTLGLAACLVIAPLALYLALSDD